MRRQLWLLLLLAVLSLLPGALGTNLRGSRLLILRTGIKVLSHFVARVADYNILHIIKNQRLLVLLVHELLLVDLVPLLIARLE